MSFKKVRYLNYIADNASDLALIPEAEIGTACYVIEEAAEYRLTSKGKWVKQIPPSAGGNGSTDVDLTGYATEGYVDNAVAAIEHPTVDLSSYATKEYTDAKAREVSNKIPNLDGYAMTVEVEAIKSNPVFKMFDTNLNPAGGGSYGVYLPATDGRTIAEVMREKGIGLVNIWVQKGHSSLPQSMINDNTSGRGFACVDYQNVENANDFIGYVVLFDKLNTMYYQFISHGTAGPWMKVSAEQA